MLERALRTCGRRFTSGLGVLGVRGRRGVGRELVVAVEAVEALRGARGPSEASAALQMAVAGETRWRTPRRAWGSSEIEGCNTLRLTTFEGELRICASKRGTLV